MAQEFYKQHLIVTGQEGRGWWAIIYPPGDTDPQKPVEVRVPEKIRGETEEAVIEEAKDRIDKKLGRGNDQEG